MVTAADRHISTYLQQFCQTSCQRQYHLSCSYEKNAGTEKKHLAAGRRVRDGPMRRSHIPVSCITLILSRGFAREELVFILACTQRKFTPCADHYAGQSHQIITAIMPSKGIRRTHTGCVTCKSVPGTHCPWLQLIDLLEPAGSNAMKLTHIVWDVNQPSGHVKATRNGSQKHTGKSSPLLSPAQTLQTFEAWTFIA